MFLNLDEFEKELDGDKQDELIHEALNNCDADDPPFLSAILVHAEENAALRTMEILASGQYPFQWHIMVLRGEFGESFKPGDVVTRVVPINRVKRNGDLVTPRVMSLAKKDGSYERKYERKKQFKVDSKGCISCGYDDAVYFLNNWGYNKKTNSAVTKKPEYSYEPVDVKDFTKGQKKHVRYWRYAEMDKFDYEALPTIQTGKK